jgi:hypothetical protein
MGPGRFSAKRRGFDAHLKDVERFIEELSYLNCCQQQLLLVVCLTRLTERRPLPVFCGCAE